MDTSKICSIQLESIRKKISKGFFQPCRIVFKPVQSSHTVRGLVHFVNVSENYIESVEVFLNSTDDVALFIWQGFLVKPEFLGL